MTFGGSLRHGLRGLVRWKGRDTRGAFWPFAGAMFGVTQLAGMLLAVPFFAGAFGRIQRFAVEHPDQVRVQQGPGSYSMQVHGAHPELMPDMSGFAGVVESVASLFILLVAAAVIRRLHDTGRTGWWGLLPLPFLATSFALFGHMIASFGAARPDFGLFGLLFANNLCYLVTLVTLIILLAQPGQRTGNRFGPAPAVER